MCKCATYVQVAAEGEEGIQCPGAGVIVNCELPTWVLETTQEGLQCTSKYRVGTFPPAAVRVLVSSDSSLLLTAISTPGCPLELP